MHVLLHVAHAALSRRAIAIDLRRSLVVSVDNLRIDERCSCLLVST